MTEGRKADLRRLDVSLLALRRLVDLPASGPTIDHEAVRVERSTMLVVDAISRADAAGDECDIGRVATTLRVAHSTASRLVDRAVEAGMVRRASAAADARRSVLSLTAAGERLQHGAVEFRTGRLGHLVQDWPEDDVAALATLLERFVRAADRQPPLRRRTP